MDRRRFAAMIASALAAPLLCAQVPERIRRIGFLQILARKELEDLIQAFEGGLRDHGWVNGKNLAIEFRFAEGKIDRLPALALELEKLGVEIIVTGTNPGTRAVLDATARVPIVTPIGTNVVEAGFAASLAKPGGRVTGLVFVLGVELYGKRLEILKEAVPKASRVAILWDPSFENSSDFKPTLERAATALKLSLVWIVVAANEDADGFVARAIRERADSLFVVGGAKTYGLRLQIVQLAAKHRMPAMYDSSAFTDAGGLLSHAPSLAAAFRECTRFVDKILKGASPGDLAIERPVKFETVVNLKAAKALGLTIPQSVLVRADRVIE